MAETILKPYKPANKVVMKFTGKGRTRQEFKEECDINHIMARFVRTGVIDHFSVHGPQYGECPALEFQEALHLVDKAQTMFDALPAKVRKKFENDPAQFLEFVQDERNHAEMVEMGLAKPIDEPPAPPPSAPAPPETPPA